MRFPPELNGRGLAWSDEVVALEEIGTLGTSLACLYSLPAIVGEAINKFGSPELKAHFLKSTARAIDAGIEGPRARRLVSEAKKFATETCWSVVNAAMQIMGGIGYTYVYLIERLLRDTRLIMIWTGTNEVMDIIIQHEYYKELAGQVGNKRDYAADAVNAHLTDEKIYE